MHYLPYTKSERVLTLAVAILAVTFSSRQMVSNMSQHKLPKRAEVLVKQHDLVYDKKFINP